MVVLIQLRRNKKKKVRFSGFPFCPLQAGLICTYDEEDIVFIEKILSGNRFVNSNISQ